MRQFIPFILVLSFLSCQNQKAPVELQKFTIKQPNGIAAEITNLGGIIMKLMVPTADGTLRDVVLGFDEPQMYLDPHPYFGTIVGRYANRIAGGQFSIDGTTYAIDRNEGSKTLHGGSNGWDKVLWQVQGHQSHSLSLTHRSPDGDEGFPGSVEATVHYEIVDDKLIIKYSATTDKPTVINMTNHSYFNLNGAGKGTILDHELMINADSITAVDDALIPTGAFMPVEGTAFDFSNRKKIGASIDDDHPQLKIAGGYDHNYCVNVNDTTALTVAATVTSDDQKVTMHVLTDEPGIQLYTANFLNAMGGKGGATYGRYGGFCLETQHFPDSPNQAHFPSTILRPGAVYESTTVYLFE